MENEMPQLSTEGAKLVALDRRCSGGFARSLIDVEISLERFTRQFLMPATNNTTSNGFSATGDGLQWSGMDSDFRLVIMAALRSKQLLHGAAARIETDPLRRKNTSIALEEVKRGLVQFTTKSLEEADTE